MQRSQIINLAAGPSSLPEAVLAEAAAGLLNYNGTGIGVTELSHRSADFQDLTNNLEHQIRSALNVPQTHVILFTQGGGCGMFSSVVYNLLARHYLLYPDIPDGERTLDYIITGSWSKKAAEEARLLTVGTKAKVNVVVDAREHSASGKAFDRIPKHDSWKFSPAPAFVYYCDNETVDGVQFSNDSSSSAAFPHHLLPKAIGSEIAPIPLVGDHSSSFLSRPILNMEQHALIYAGAQKNVGPSGLTILIVRKDLLVDTVAAAKLSAPPTPTTMSYKVLADAGSLYNTPPMFSMYVSLLAVKYYAENGGLVSLEKLNRIKKEKVYEALDEGVKAGVFQGRVEKDSRSWMNVTFTLKNPELEKSFLTAATEKGMRGMKGHRSVGGIRFSLYNAVTERQVDIIVAFMRQFTQEHVTVSP